MSLRRTALGAAFLVAGIAIALTGWRTVSAAGANAKFRMWIGFDRTELDGVSPVRSRATAVTGVTARCTVSVRLRWRHDTSLLE